MGSVRQKSLASRSFIMDEETVLRVHRASLEILETIGVAVQHPSMRDRLASAGCQVAGERVWLPGELVMSMMSKIPSTLTLWGREPGFEVVLDGKRMYGCNTGAMPFLADLEGRVRPATLQDVCNFTYISDALPNIHVVVSQPLVAQDIPVETVILESFLTVTENSVKPQWLLVTNSVEARCAIDMGSMIRGSLDALRQRPFFFVGVCPLSPLTYVADITDAILAAAMAGLPTAILPAPVMGVTSPVTVAGAIAQLNAEVLAGMVMVQLVNPGCPMIRLGVIEPMDPRSASVARGSPLLGLTRVGYTQLCQYYDQPFAIGGFYGTSAKVLDYQSGYEKALNGFISALLQPDILMGASGLAGNIITSLECLVLDDEILGMLYQILQGYRVNEDTLGIEAIRQAVEGGEVFLAQRHTARHIRLDGAWLPELADWTPFGAWLEGTQTNVLEQARRKAQRLLTEHNPPPLPNTLVGELRCLIGKARQELAAS